ncbi:MAG: NAD-dependent DNA ligase LigA [Bacteroidetes bacterium]|nr:NAD-dependent DNA ligase LigA [Bacteroidota bacterium]
MYSEAQEKGLYADGIQLLQKSHFEIEDIQLLKEVINFADYRYYILSNSVFTDVEYDTLFKALQKLEEHYPNYVTADSPTQRVAQGISEKFQTVKHLVPMLSLDNTYNADDLKDWDRRCKELSGLDEIEYCIEPKYDGASISLIYDHNQLQRGATRGDGIMGEEITPNIKQIRSIPLRANFSEINIEQIEIRGEAIIHKDVFEQFNSQRISEGLQPLANPRNAASGTLRMLDSNEVSKRRLSAVLYHVSYYALKMGKDLPESLQTHYDTILLLHQNGFLTPINEMKKFRHIDEVIQFCHDFEARRDHLPYEVDGLVIKVNAIALQEKMGMTSHHPRWAVAFKFKARQATSQLLRVEFQVGRTGSVTPVAKINPVAIGGVMVSSVSLFNEDVVREKDLHIGDIVLVERAGDVIPYIVKALPEMRTGSESPIVFPTHCPDCGELLEKPEDEAVWRCINISCPSQVVERLTHFCSKDAMDIRGMGISNVKKFYDLGIVKDIPGLYRIDWNRVGALEGFGDKSINNLQQAIEASKAQPLHRLIFGLGIRQVGETMAKTLAQAVSEISDFYSWPLENYLPLDDVGPKVAASVFDFFALVENRTIIQSLIEAGLNTKSQKQGSEGFSGTFSGKTFLFTGTLSQLKRSEAEAIVEKLGGKIATSVSSKLNYLIVGTDAGSKLEKAKKLTTISILSEEQFLTLVNQ